MRIEHLAIWVNDLEKTKAFYETFFETNSGKRYHNASKNFNSYFLSFDSGARLELMHKPEITRILDENQEGIGLAHFAVSVGSKGRVDVLTEKLRSNGFFIVGAPRTTGDGYYESVVLDPEGNRIEITI